MLNSVNLSSIYSSQEPLRKGKVCQCHHWPMATATKQLYYPTIQTHLQLCQYLYLHNFGEKTIEHNGSYNKRSEIHVT